MSQLTYLGFLNKDAYQNVTVHCKNSIAWYDYRKRNHNKALRFKGTEEQVFEHIPTDENNDMSRYTPEVLKDDCQYQSQAWKETVLKFESHKFIRLPIIDMAPVYNSDADSMFGLELGPVCFT